MNTREFGEIGERIAAQFLRLKGYELIDANVRYARREVDILARDGQYLVAVEVKLRRGRGFGAAAEAIDARKLSRVQAALAGFARESDLSPRVDVVTIDVDESGDRMTVEHYVGVT
ncbi:MAG TPA: YraN family protein [Candidatus Krumholzibacteria bacterium]|nr:YraN family protein [Candidatus Krumholzibacteria bacterium]